MALARYNPASAVGKRLIPYLPKLVGTVSPQHERERAQYAAWQAVTVIAPLVLEAVPLTKHAARLRALPYHNWIDAGASATNITIAAAGVAAGAAAAAAGAAAALAETRREDPWAPAFGLLDGMLTIGPASLGFTPKIEDRIGTYRALFEEAA